MPNASEHQIGSGIFFLFYWITSPWISSLSLGLVGVILAFLGGMMPDILEPATWPGHRGLWHYLVGALVVIPAIALHSGNNSGFIIGSFCIGYFSHFVLDVVM